MSVRLALFPEIAVLRVRRAIGARQVQVLVAGIRRVFEVGVKVVLVDARGAEFDDAAALAYKSIEPALGKNKKGIRLVIVTADKRVGEFPNLESAFAALELPGKEDLAQWFTAEDELDILLALKADLESKMGAGGEEGRKRAKKARGERIRVERMKEVLSATLAQWGKRIGIWKRQPATTEAKGRLKNTLMELRRERKTA